jgi:hypothetical protein
MIDLLAKLSEEMSLSTLTSKKSDQNVLVISNKNHLLRICSQRRDYVRLQDLPCFLDEQDIRRSTLYTLPIFRRPCCRASDDPLAPQNIDMSSLQTCAEALSGTGYKLGTSANPSPDTSVCPSSTSRLGLASLPETLPKYSPHFGLFGCCLKIPASFPSDH